MDTRPCSWPGADAAMIEYHDTEWGTPQHDDRILFEYLVLDMFQAGLSWRTILHKRRAFAAAFANFDWLAVAQFGEEDVIRLMNDKGIVRNGLKIRAAIANARKYELLRQEFGSFSNYCWRFVGNAAIEHVYTDESQIGAHSPESDELSRDMRARGFKFVGTTILYAFMQGAGLINDHIVSCPRHREVMQ